MNNDSTASGGDASFGGVFHVDAAPIAGPRTPPFPPLPTRARLSGMSPHELASLLEQYLAARRHRPLAELARSAAHADGSLQIPSMEAVWLLAQLGKHVGHQPLINLRHVDNLELLRSVRGVAILALAALAQLEQTT